jgi:hypothetical protein
MENTARLFNCARCHSQVVICSHCDRGNIYCGPNCSQQARRESKRAAGRRYQRSRRGRFAHAQRQRRYRTRRHKVTHQGSAPTLPHDSLEPESRASPHQSLSYPVVPAQGLFCHLCKRPCSAFLRLDFLHSRGSRLIRPPGCWPSPDT